MKPDRFKAGAGEGGRELGLRSIGGVEEQGGIRVDAHSVVSRRADEVEGIAHSRGGLGSALALDAAVEQGRAVAQVDDNLIVARAAVDAQETEGVHRIRVAGRGAGVVHEKPDRSPRRSTDHPDYV